MAELLPLEVAAAQSGMEIAIHDDLAAVADTWRGFEREADCTAFQTFAWHEAWQRNVGAPAGVRPVIVVGRCGRTVLFLLPLAIVRRGLIRSLVWHATDLCDYNAPLVAPDFGEYFAVGDFTTLFARILKSIAAKPGAAYDLVSLTKMPEMIGTQPNPFMALPTSLNPNGAYSTRLGTDWEEFYSAKRSSTTRRRDRTKRKKLGALGEVRFVSAETTAARTAALDVLMGQKSKAFDRMGVPDLFARPDIRAFYRDLVADPATLGFVHMSELQVGAAVAAVNLGLIFGDVYYHVLASYDAEGEVARFGPGAVHKLHDYRAAATAQGLVVSTAENAVASLKRRIKQSPTLWAMVVKLRALRGRRSAAPAQPQKAAGEDEAD